MTDFVFSELVHDPLARVEDGALGTGGINAAHTTGNIWGTTENGKPVKLGGAGFVACAADDAIDGFVSSVEVMTVNDGYSFGSVKRGGRVLATVGTDQGATPMAVGDFVVAGAGTAAVGTAGGGMVKTLVLTGFTTNADPAIAALLKARWRCIRLVTGTGISTNLVLLEKV